MVGFFLLIFHRFVARIMPLMDWFLEPFFCLVLLNYTVLSRDIQI
jgi:hypothetical protein